MWWVVLVIVNVSAKGAAFPIQALREIDSLLAAAGFKKEVHSVVVPGKEFSITYDGPTMEKSRIEGLLQPVAAQNRIGMSIEVEESVKFP